MKQNLLIFPILLITLSLTIPSIHAISGSLGATPPQNIIYQDDFENYTSTTCQASTGTTTIGNDNGQITGSCLGGWAYIDNNCNSMNDRAINQTYSFSPIHSLSLTAAKASAKCDIDKRIVINNSTKIVQSSVYFTIPNSLLSANNRASVTPDTGFHIALEVWDTSTHWEAVTFILANTCSAVATAAAVDFVGDGAAGVTQGTDHCGQHLIRPYDKTGDFSTAYWHRLTVSINVVTHTWNTVQLDDDNYNYLMAGRALRSIADTSFNNVGTLTGIRQEFAVIGASTFSATTDQYWVQFDDLQIIDKTPGTVNCGVQFFANTGTQPSTTVNPGCVNVTTSQIGILSGLLASIVLVTFYYGKRKKQIDLLKQVRV